MPEHDEDIDDLVAQLRDGEDSERECLAELLRDQPEQRERFLRQMFLSGLLREAFSESETESVAKPRRRWIFPALAAAAALVLAAVAFWPRVDGTLVATIESAEGSVLIDGEKAGAGAAIEPGQVIELRGSTTLASFRYPDGTRVLIDGEARLTLADTNHKHLAVARGVLHADVAKQPWGKPMRIVTPSAELEIVGTRFVVGTGRGETDLNVTEGLVRMKRTDGAAVDVAAGKRARFSTGHTLKVSELPEVPDHWRRDFETDGKLAGDAQGLKITEALPGGSSGGIATLPFEFRGTPRRGLRVRNMVDGYCRVVDGTHFHLTFRTQNWFNLFISTSGPDEHGQLQIRRFKLGASNLYRWARVSDEWHSLVVPITAFTEHTGIRRFPDEFGRKPDHDGFGGPPPEIGHVIHDITMTHPDDAPRDLQVDSFGFAPDGPGEKVMTTIGR